MVVVLGDDGDVVVGEYEEEEEEEEIAAEVGLRVEINVMEFFRLPLPENVVLLVLLL